MHNDVKVASLLPSNKNRSLLVHSLISAFRLSAIENLDGSKALQVLKPIEATQKDLSAYHGRDYLDYVLDPKSSSGHNFGATRITAEFGLEDVSSLMSIFCNGNVPTSLGLPALRWAPGLHPTGGRCIAIIDKHITSR